MSKELTFIIEPNRGKLTIEVGGVSTDDLADLRANFDSPHNVNCGKPSDVDISKPANQIDALSDDHRFIWLYTIYHRSVVDGPGVRSVVQVSGCTIRCSGCYVPETHNRLNGKRVPISSIVADILREKNNSDGVTILGGEPFDQAEAVGELVASLKIHGINVTVYTGYTIDALIQRNVPSINYILTHIDLLIDGPFLSSERVGVGEYRGSMNQRIIRILNSRKKDSKREASGSKINRRFEMKPPFDPVN